MSIKFPVLQLLFLFICSNCLLAQSLNLSVVGKNEIETKIIDSISYTKSHKDYLSLDSEIKRLKKKYNSSGYLESILLELKKENDSTFTAKFNLRNRYNVIHIYYNGIIDKSMLDLISENITDSYFEIEVKKLENTLQLLNSEIANNGDPFSTLQLANIRKKDDTALVADLSVSKQSKRLIDKIVVKGYEKFPKSYLNHYLKIKPKQNFNLKKVKEKTLSLNNLQFANKIKDSEVLFSKDSTILYMYVEKTKSNAFDGFLGFGTNEQTGKIEFDGYLNLNLTNNLNFGESIKLLYKSDENEQKTFDVKIDMPYLFGSPIGLGLELNIFKKDSTFVTSSQTAKINYQINPSNSISVGITSTTSTDLLDINSFSINDYKSNQYFLNYTHVKRQNYDLLFPTNFLFDISAGIGNRKTNNKNFNQSKFTINSFKIFNLNRKNNIYLRLNGAILNSDTYLENELLRFGGINSIRGFEENSLTADLYAVLNTEYRYKLNNSLYVHSVIDASYFENQSSNAKEKLFGFGFGFGLLTKAGLFKFNYTSAKTENQKFKFSDSKVHLSLTTSF
ncbi:BamA/TamA family outer membrane protein [Ichthyenterobacterium magnum]|uniref:Outer membrane protein assembly factor BamA n=1 Tax=Ichthyenterobacterium magnum TaxID=1230530 RepID=A0A420DF15_9FLAO|nr:hypothetical protein [Ichthyenterobacterium magnum]RKE90960.1 outer membrane protein assembly factor BamA [Ichthyenterobacterium magnum]